MNTYRAQLPEDVVTFLTDTGGPLGLLADHVRDGDEFAAPGWTYLDETCIRALNQLSEHSDGTLATDAGDLVMSVEGHGYLVEHVQES